jgi:hypothetical protein
LVLPPWHRDSFCRNPIVEPKIEGVYIGRRTPNVGIVIEKIPVSPSEVVVAHRKLDGAVFDLGDHAEIVGV